MALDKPAGGGKNRRPSFQGNVVMRVQRGIEVAAAWPPKMKKSARKLQAERMEFFRQVQWAWKFTYPAYVQQLTAAVKGTPLLPRDLYLSQMAGRLLGLQLPNGAWIVSVAVQNDVSETLDYLTSIPGSILIRGEEGWIGLNPGALGQVLTMGAAPDLPSWEDAGGGGGGAGTLIPRPSPGNMRFTTTSNIAGNISMLLTHAPLEVDTLIARLRLPTRSNPSGNWKPVIYDWGAIDDQPQVTTGAALVATGPAVTMSAGINMVDMPFDAPTLLPGGRLYLVGWHRNGGSLQLSQTALNETRTFYSTTTVLAAPPAALPAMSISTGAGVSWFTENS